MWESVSIEPEPTETSITDKVWRKKKRWSDFSPRQRQAIVLGAVAELAMTTIAVADLARRPARQLRGSKPVWLVTFLVQPIGPILYLLAGRRTTR